MPQSILSLMHEGKLTVCIDDFGLTPGINQAVIDLATNGKINATSILVDGKYLDEADIEQLYLLKHQGKLQLGLHLNFTELLSEAQDPDLVKPIGKQILSNLTNLSKFNDAIYNEICRQFFTFEQLFDRYPDYIDGHQHVHLLPAIFNNLVRFYQEYRLDQEKIWIRSLNRVHLLNNLKLPGISAKKNWILRFVTKKAKTKIFYLRRELLGVYNFDQDEQGYAQLLHKWLLNARNYIQSTGRGAVIMVHPADPQLDTPADYDDPIATARRVEYRVLQDFDYGMVA